MGRFVLERVISAPLEAVFEAADFTKSAGPFPMEVQQEGDPAQHGAGFQRIVTAKNMKVVERLLSADPPHSYTYTLLDGAPVKPGYRGKAEFLEKDGATLITWTGEFTPKYPGTGWLVVLMSKWTITKILDAVEKACQNAAH